MPETYSDKPMTINGVRITPTWSWSDTYRKSVRAEMARVPKCPEAIAQQYQDWRSQNGRSPQVGTCDMADAKRIFDVIDPTTAGVYGSICYYKSLKGWLFISMISGRGNSTTVRKAALAAMPLWAKKAGATLKART